MKRRTEDIDSHIMHVPLRPDEYEVCEILVQLPRLIAESEYRKKFPIVWCAKRRRSALESSPHVSRLLVSSSSSQFLQKSAAPRPSCETEEEISTATAEADASSPLTPLAFSRSESDEKPKRLKSKCTPKSNEEYWLKMVEGLTRRRETLKTELEKVERHYEKLKALNNELIARKQELRLGLRREEMQLVIGNSNPSVESSRPTSKSPAQDSQENQQQIPVINLHESPIMDDQTSQISQITENFEYPSGQKIPSASLFEVAKCDVSPLGIPDLNVSPEETIWMDNDSHEAFGVDLASKQTTKAVAAEARHRRMQIYKMKNNIIARKFHYSCR